MTGHDYLNGCDVIVVGAGDKVYTDKATVKTVQTALHTLAQQAGPAYDPGKIDGKIGPNTKAAVKAFNSSYGWPADGENITDGTLTALKRPDVINPASFTHSTSDSGVSTAMPVTPDAASYAATALPKAPSAVAPQPSTPTVLYAGVGVLAVGLLALALTRK